MSWPKGEAAPGIACIITGVALTLTAQVYLLLHAPGKSLAIARNQPRALV